MTLTDRAPGPPQAPGRTRVPGQPDMWVFVGFETLLFTAYFCVYLFSRTQHEHLFLRQQSHLLGWLGALDTVVLLTSSWAVACAVQHARAGRLAAARRDALLTAACGALFLVLKIAEWVRLVHLGDTFTSGPFFTYYFFLTGIHVVHLLIGFVVLGVLVARLTRPTEGSQVVVETCATYWHTVDFFWVLIFALLYVVR